MLPQDHLISLSLKEEYGSYKNAASLILNWLPFQITPDSGQLKLLELVELLADYFAFPYRLFHILVSFG